jgi:hypothetical protein
MSLINERTSARNSLQFHPLADIFPLMEGAEFDERVADIKANGLREKIDLYQGKIADGRNRYRALKQLGIDPSADDKQYFRKAIYTHSAGGEIKSHEQSNDEHVRAYIISKNIHRRHLTAEQKRDIIAKLIKAGPEKSDRRIAKTIKASPTTVGTMRATMETKGDVSKLDTRIDTQGRKQPAKRARKPAKKTKSKPKATLDKLFDELFFEAAPIKAAPSEPEREAVRARQDIGPASTGEVERLRARVDELQAEKRQLEIKIVGLKSEIEELKAERDELRERNEVAKTRTDDGLDIPEFLRRSEQ